MSLVESHPYLTTFTGRRVMLEHMQPDDICIEDIVQATSNLCRFGGHLKRFYSVAEHQVRACRLAEIDHGVGSEVAQCALLHDAPEAYVGDVPLPLKVMLPDYAKIEKRVTWAVGKALGLPDEGNAIWDEVKRYDQIILMREASMLFRECPSWVDLSIANDPHYFRDDSWDSSPLGTRPGWNAAESYRRVLETYGYS